MSKRQARTAGGLPLLDVGLAVSERLGKVIIGKVAYLTVVSGIVVRLEV